MLQAINQVNFKGSELVLSRSFKKGKSKLNLNISAVNKFNSNVCQVSAWVSDGKHLADGVTYSVAKRSAPDYAEDVYDAMRKVGALLSRYKDEIPDKDDIMRSLSRFFGEFWAK